MSQADIFSTTGFIPAVVPVSLSAAEVEQAPAIRRFTADEYHRLGEVGILGGDERVELLEGIVTMMPPIGVAHLKAVTAAHKRLQRLAPGVWQAVCQQPIRLQASEPVPDIALIRGNVRNYADLPDTSNVGLVVEVAETTLRQDRGLKASIYAAASIAEYWIVNLVDRRLEVHRQPVAATGESPARYKAVNSLASGQSVDVVLDGAPVGTIAVNDLLQ